MAHTLTLWTNDVERAVWADRAGVDRIGVDLETHGKRTRQSGLSTWISEHSLEDLARLQPCVEKASLFVRANPLHDGSADEIEAFVGQGAGIIMLPNFTQVEEVARFTDLVGGRARVVPLVERVAAAAIIGRLPALGVSEIHIGLNDLSIDLGQANRLRVLGMPMMDTIAAEAHRTGLNSVSADWDGQAIRTCRFRPISSTPNMPVSAPPVR